MRYEKFGCTVNGSLEYANLTTYIIDSSEEFAINDRPLVLICPGGGYEYLSDREAELIAFQFMAKGYHAAVLHYSVSPAVYPTALLEVAKCMIIIREHAKEWHVIPDKIVVQGSSAGGHLAASYGVFWTDDFVAKNIGADKEMLRPNGLMLNYPVITSGSFAHKGSFNALLHGQYTEDMLQKNSLEDHVNNNVPRTFLWHTYEDDCVLVENSLLFIWALRNFRIPTEFHMYEKGAHGLGLANALTKCPDGSGIQHECESWIELACTWMKNL